VTPPAEQTDTALRAVEARIASIIDTSDELVLSYIEDISRGHGKLIRPRLLIAMAGLFGEAPLESVANCAACCEMLHTASLIHDDVIDQAQFRRGLPTLSSRFGNELAVVVGDYVLALVLQALNRERDFNLTGMILETSRQIGLGVIEEILNRNNFKLSVEKYYDVIYYKTAALFCLAAEMGAYTGGAPCEARELVLEYAKQLGLGFQVVDDLLDLTQDPAATGKPGLSDIREGRITLPVIHALTVEPEATKHLIEAFQKEESPESAAAIKAQLERLGSIDTALEAARTFLVQARAAAVKLERYVRVPGASTELERIEAKVLRALPVQLAVEVK
jgi:octaprenyl-diphosphate synthase